MKRETIKAGQVTIEFLLEAADTNGSAAMFEFTVPAGAKVPVPHYHEHFDETIYGHRVTIEFLRKLRDEVRYPDLDSLTRQIRVDVAQARDYFAAQR